MLEEDRPNSSTVHIYIYVYPRDPSTFSGSVRLDPGGAYITASPITVPEKVPLYPQGVTKSY